MATDEGGEGGGDGDGAGAGAGGGVWLKRGGGERNGSKKLAGQATANLGDGAVVEKIPMIHALAAETSSASQPLQTVKPRWRTRCRRFLSRIYELGAQNVKASLSCDS